MSHYSFVILSHDRDLKHMIRGNVGNLGPEGLKKALEKLDTLCGLPCGMARELGKAGDGIMVCPVCTRKAMEIIPPFLR